MGWVHLQIFSKNWSDAEVNLLKLNWNTSVGEVELETSSRRCRAGEL